ncbi:MAG: histidine--tRNA ligase [Gammaproteobacteria bacterium]|nr:histidine--tRNA ligase [Gammaproteobacteria bacterium]
MSNSIQAIRGMNDLLPERLERWQRVERVARSVFHAYGYREVRLPILEKTELFARSIGQHTDIVEKEMYSFADRNGDKLSLRPEGTAGVVRAGIQSGDFRSQLQRWWYAGPMFRHERPQRGRYRQFYQMGVEAFGVPGPDIDAELVVMSARLWRSLGLKDLNLEINSLGTPQSREVYRQALVTYFSAHESELDADSVRRLEHNPLRILDSKNPDMQAVIQAAPSLLDFLDQESVEHFGQLQASLDNAGITYNVNPRLVRGLDYYVRTVFEWTTQSLGAQGTVCAGGRYDGLVVQLGGKPTPAIGFALGMERLVELMSEQQIPGDSTDPAVFMIMVGDAAQIRGIAVAEEMRDAGLQVQCNCNGGSFKAQMKRADRSGARYAVILGDDEMAANHATVKPLRHEVPQQQIAMGSVARYLAEKLDQID